MERLTILFCFFTWFSWSQVDQEQVLYRGIENKILLPQKDVSIQVTDTNVHVMVKNDSLSIKLPAMYSYNQVQLVLQSASSTVPDTLEIPVVFLPDPVIELFTPRGVCGGSTRIRSNLTLGSKKEIEFHVLNYTLEFNGVVCNGYGNFLSADCMGLISQMYLGDSLILTGKVRGPDGMIRQVQSKWVLE